MSRINEFDELRGLAILLVFLIHSDFRIEYYDLYYLSKELALGIFFLVSGYLLFLSLRKYSVNQVLRKKFIYLYIPFILAVVVYFYSGIFRYWPKDSIYIFPFGLSLFSKYASGVYNPYNLWFFPVLFLYILLCIGFDYIKNRNLKISLMFTLYLGLCLAYRFIGLSGAIETYYIPFFSGYLLADFDLFEKLDVGDTPFLLISAFLLGAYSFKLIPRFAPNVFVGQTIDLTVAGLFGLVLSLLLFLIFRKVSISLFEKIGKYTLGIYILEPLVSYSIIYLSLGIKAVEIIHTPVYPIILVVRILATVLLAYLIFKIMEKFKCVLKNV